MLWKYGGMRPRSLGSTITHNESARLVSKACVNGTARERLLEEHYITPDCVKWIGLAREGFERMHWLRLARESFGVCHHASYDSPLHPLKDP